MYVSIDIESASLIILFGQDIVYCHVVLGKITTVLHITRLTVNQFNFLGTSLMFAGFVEIASKRTIVFVPV